MQWSYKLTTTKQNFVHLFKVLEHGMAIADLDDEQELIQTQQDTRRTSLSTSDMCDLENKSEVWHRIHVCERITIQCARKQSCDTLCANNI